MKNKQRIALGALLDKAGLLSRVTAHLAAHRSSPLEALSMRELQIMVAIAHGTTPAEASQALGIAVKSFSTYRERVLSKLGLGSNAEIAVLGFELGLVPSVLARFKEAK